MSTITVEAAADQGAALVKLTIESTATIVSITRADANGTRPVRLPAATLPAPGGTLVVKDYEAALSGPVKYTARTADAEGFTWSALDLTLPRFVMPSLPLFTVEVDTVFDYAATRESRATVHYVVGRTDPIVIQARMGTRTGSLGILCPDHGAVVRLLAMLSRGQTVLYRQAEHQGVDMYFIPLSAALKPGGRSWEVDVSYVEVGFPSAPVQSDPSWTFAKLASTGGTFAQVATDYQDYIDLTLNRKAAGL